MNPFPLLHWCVCMHGYSGETGRAVCVGGFSKPFVVVALQRVTELHSQGWAHGAEGIKTVINKLNSNNINRLASHHMIKDLTVCIGFLLLCQIGLITALK